MNQKEVAERLGVFPEIFVGTSAHKRLYSLLKLKHS